ncbi:hypothetical protein GF326_03790 [Candidatus Bathyarchaeota archaeon]|nr:hypothetical protein [Candidatus Bathyarchaeota archaeon]
MIYNGSDGGLYDEFNSLGEDQEYYYRSNESVKVRRSKNVILISLDGFSRERFNEFKDNLTTIGSLIDEGWTQYNVTNFVYYTQTRNGHATMLSGYLGESTGLYGNRYVYHPLPVGFSFLEKAEEEYGSGNVASAFISGKYKNIFPAFKNSMYQSLDYVHISEELPNETSGYCTDFLEEYWGCCFVAFFHFRDPDKTGHLAGEGSVEWVKSLREGDRELGDILSVFKESRVYNDTLIYITSDHGFKKNGYSHPHEPYIWLLTNDKEAKVNLDNSLIGVQDITPTICYSLDLPYDYSEPDSGHPLQVRFPDEKLEYREKFLLDKERPIIDLWGTRDTIPCLKARFSVSNDTNKLLLISDSRDVAGSVVGETEVPHGVETVTMELDRTIMRKYEEIYLLAYDAAENPSNLARIDIE